MNAPVAYFCRSLFQTSADAELRPIRAFGLFRHSTHGDFSLGIRRDLGSRQFSGLWP